MKTQNVKKLVAIKLIFFLSVSSGSNLNGGKNCAKVKSKLMQTNVLQKCGYSSMQENETDAMQIVLQSKTDPAA